MLTGAPLRLKFLPQRHLLSVDQSMRAVLQVKLWMMSPVWLPATDCMLTSQTIFFFRKLWLFNKQLRKVVVSCFFPHICSKRLSQVFAPWLKTIADSLSAAGRENLHQLLPGPIKRKEDGLKYLGELNMSFKESYVKHMKFDPKEPNLSMLAGT